jgi:purine nucleosidase
LPSPIPIAIDTDIGADPDDALALVLALASPEVEPRGVTIVSGDVARRGRIAARVLGMAGRPDIPIFLGRGDPARMSGAEGVGILDRRYDGPEARIAATSAVDWLLAESRRRPFHLVAIGLLTNVAAAMARDAAFSRRLLGLTVMGGLLDVAAMPAAWQRAIRERGAAGWPDYNTNRDPAAALTVAESRIHVTWVPLDVTMRAPLRQAARDFLPAEPPLGAALGRAIDAWRASWF